MSEDPSPGHDNPYRPSRSTDVASRPGVVTWFYVYCGLMFLLYVLVAAVGTVFLVLDPDDLDIDEPIPTKFIGLVYLLPGLIFMVPFGIAPFLPTRTWSWVYCLVLICLGMTSPCCLPASIPLLIFWIKQETRDYFAAGA